MVPARSRLPDDDTDADGAALVTCQAGVSLMSAVWSTPLVADAPVRAVHPAGPVMVLLLSSLANAASMTDWVGGPLADTASDVTALPKLPPGVMAAWYQGSRFATSMMV